MKRLFTSLVALVVCALSLAAQDIIITRNSQKIDAVITEVGLSEIKYKPVDNPNGPTYTISKSDISSIVYANGKVESFIEFAPAPQQNYGYSSTGNSVSPSNGNGTIDQLRYIGPDYYTINGKRHNEIQYLNYLRENCYEAYQDFNKRKKMLKCGLAFTIMGSVFTTAGVICIACEPDGGGGFVTGCVFIPMGVGFLGAGIPLYCIGNHYQKKSIDAYNYVKGNFNYSLNVQASQYGLGLAFNF